MKKIAFNLIKKNFAFFFIFNITFIISYFLESYSYGYILSLIENQRYNFKNFTLIVIGIYCLIFVCKLSLSECYSRLLNIFLDFRLNFTRKLNKISMGKNFNNFENYDFRVKVNRAWDFFASDISGFQAVMLSLLQILPAIILMIFSSYIIFKYSLFIIPISFIIQIACYPLQNKLNDFDFDNELEKGGVDTKLEFYQDFSTKSEFSKDIRIFELSKMILKKYNDLYNKIIIILKNKINLGIKIDIVILFLEIINDFLVVYILLRLNILGEINISRIFILFYLYQLFVSQEKSLLKNLSDLKINYKLFDSYINELAEDNQITNYIKEKGVFVVELQNVFFKYSGSEDYVLKDINMKFSSTDKIGIIGINGAGKTTLVKIILGIYMPTKGKVLINGKELTENERLHYFSAVFQNSKLFVGTLKDNLFSNINETKEDIEFINKYLNDFNLSKSNGVEINLETKFGKEFYDDAFVPSGGQEQVLTVLRALINKESMLILDEPTSFLDIPKEIKFYKTLTLETKNRGYIVISHRLAVTNIIEKIYILNNGTIEDFGTHDELIKKSDIYRKFKTLLNNESPNEEVEYE